MAGGVVGSLGGGAALTKTWTKGSVTSTLGAQAYIGGVVGWAQTGFSHALVSGAVANSGAGARGVGGLIGGSRWGQTTLVSRSIFAGSVHSQGGYVGGMMGTNEGAVGSYGNVMSGTVTAAAGGRAGGMIGYLAGSYQRRVSANIVRANVTATGQTHVSGYFAYRQDSNQRFVIHSYFEGALVGAESVGPFGGGGWSTGSMLLRSVYARGTINGTASLLSGLVGSMADANSAVIDSYSDVNITVSTSGWQLLAGGIAADLGGAVYRNVFHSGDISSTEPQAVWIGGFGSACATCLISNSFTAGTISGNYVAGGFVHTRGASAGSFSNVRWYNPGGNSLSCVYSDGALSGTSCANTADDTHFQDSANAPLSAWDFANAWRIPKLSWQAEP